MKGNRMNTMNTYYDTKMIVVFEKTAFVTFEISNYFKQNINETHSKLPNNRYQTMDFLKSLKKNQRTKSLETFAKYL